MTLCKLHNDSVHYLKCLIVKHTMVLCALRMTMIPRISMYVLTVWPSHWLCVALLSILCHSDSLEPHNDFLCPHNDMGWSVNGFVCSHDDFRYSSQLLLWHNDSLWPSNGCVTLTMIYSEPQSDFIYYTVTLCDITLSISSLTIIIDLHNKFGCHHNESVWISQ